jgi:hypothetical protein
MVRARFAEVGPHVFERPIAHVGLEPEVTMTKA